jgi:hypothetical protein
VCAAAGFFDSGAWAGEPTTKLNASANETQIIAHRTINGAVNDKALSVLFIPSLLASSMSDQAERSVRKRISAQTE